MSKNIKFSDTDKIKNTKKPYIFNSFHGNDVQKVNNNTNAIAGISCWGIS